MIISNTIVTLKVVHVDQAEGHMVSLFMTNTPVNVDMVSSNQVTCDTCQYHVIMRYYFNKTCKWICIIFFLVLITQLFIILKKYFFTFNSRQAGLQLIFSHISGIFRLIFYDDTTSTIPWGWTENLSNDLNLDQELQQIKNLNVPIQNFSFHPSCSCRRCKKYTK